MTRENVVVEVIGGGPNEELVARLEELLAKAKDGDLRSMHYGTFSRGGDMDYDTVGDDGYMFTQIALMQTHLVSHTIFASGLDQVITGEDPAAG